MIAGSGTDGTTGATVTGGATGAGGADVTCGVDVTAMTAGADATAGTKAAGTASGWHEFEWLTCNENDLTQYLIDLFANFVRNQIYTDACTTNLGVVLDHRGTQRSMFMCTFLYVADRL